MSILHFQSNIMIFFVYLGVAFFSAAGAIEFYISIKKPSKEKLIDFRNLLPLWLQKIYFNGSHAQIYGAFEEIPSIDYLIEKSNKFRALSVWFFFTVIFMFILIRYYAIGSTNQLYGDDNLIDIINVISIALIHIRASFFGIRIKSR